MQNTAYSIFLEDGLFERLKVSWCSFIPLLGIGIYATVAFPD